MKKSICLAISFLFMSASALTAQKRIVMESSADEFVTLWDNTTAKHSNYETKDEEDRGRKFANTSSADLYIFKAPKLPDCGILHYVCRMAARQWCYSGCA